MLEIANRFFNLRSLVGADYVSSHILVWLSSRQSFCHRNFDVLWKAEHLVLWLVILFVSVILT